MTDIAELGFKVDTSGLSSAVSEENKLIATSKKLETAESTLTSANKKLDTTNKNLAASTDAVEREAKQAAAAQNAAAVATSKANVQANTFVSNTKKAGAASGNATYKIGQLGLQAQDVAVQLEAGTNAGRVFTQQFGQIASVFGPAGAIVGAIGVTVGAIAGPLISTLFSAENATEDLLEKVRDLTDEYKRATYEQKQLARDDISKRIAEETKIRDEAKTKLKEYIAEEKELLRVQGGIGLRATELSRLINEQTAIVQTSSQAIKKYKDEQEDVGGVERGRVENVKTLIAALGDELATITMSEEALLKRQFTQAGATEAEINAALAIQKTIDAEKEKAKVIEENAKLEQELEKVETQQADPAARAAIAFENRNKIIQDANDRGLIDQAKYDQLRIDNANKLQSELVSIEEKTQKQKNEILTAGEEAALSSAGSLFGNLASIAAEGGEKQFQAYKNLASAQAAIAAALASIKALAEGGPLGPALAVSIGAVAAVQIAKIQGQEYQARVAGGQVQAGGQYLVGENGPELLQIGSQGGNITPNHAMNSNTQTTQQIFQISAGVAGTVRAEIMSMLPMFKQLAVSSAAQNTRNGGQMAKAVGLR